MLRIRIVALGKNKEEWVDRAVEHYLKLLKKFASVSFTYIPDIKKSKKTGPNELIKQESRLIKKHLRAGYRVALSDKGRLFNSEEFARFLLRLTEISGGSVDFVIGGIHGLGASILKSCNENLSLSPLTMSHQLIRPILLEQIYRGFSIISGGKYHK